MNLLGNLIGELCNKIIPIPEEVFVGNQKSSITVCTLSSISLLKEIKSSTLLSEISIVGRLMTENKGIDALIRYIISHENIRTVIVCGKEVWGHKAGQSLFAVHTNGISSNDRIIGSTSPEPFLTVTKDQVDKFRNQVKLIDLIGETTLEGVTEAVNSVKN